MSSVDKTKWTCDRCDRVEMRDVGHPPWYWKKSDGKDLCKSCVDEHDSWWRSAAGRNAPKRCEDEDE